MRKRAEEMKDRKWEEFRGIIKIVLFLSIFIAGIAVPAMMLENRYSASKESAEILTESRLEAIKDHLSISDSNKVVIEKNKFFGSTYTITYEGKTYQAQFTYKDNKAKIDSIAEGGY
ncbi:hypothetical protein MKY91_20610 [Alkalicoccobacillus gibsonii]|uniref:DUF3139 domain-containing protein n=1 Tax=Alkalicoccobacillus gibsonii TaxID=79881 RepID=A0ABU9VNU4_9BACI